MPLLPPFLLTSLFLIFSSSCLFILRLSLYFSLISLGVTWQLLKSDVAATLTGVCNKILHDRSVTADVLRQRREGKSSNSILSSASLLVINLSIKCLQKRITKSSNDAVILLLRGIYTNSGHSCIQKIQTTTRGPKYPFMRNKLFLPFPSLSLLLHYILSPSLHSFTTLYISLPLPIFLFLFHYQFSYFPPSSYYHRHRVRQKKFWC